MDPNARTLDGDPVSRQTIITWQYAPSPYEQAFIAPGIAPSIAPGMPAFMTPADPVTVFQMPRKVGEYLPISHEEQYLNFRPSKHEVSLIQSAHSSRDDSDRLSLPSEDTPCLRVKLLCSYGGKILPRPGDSRLRYVGGETRIIVVNRDATFLEFMSKMKEVCHQTVALKYQLPDEDLDALISVTSDEDVENMIDEFDKLDSRDSAARLRVFLFASENDNNSIVDNLEQKNSEQQYLDAINGLSESGSKRSSLSSDSGSVKKPSYPPASVQLPDSLDMSETRQVQGAVLSSFPSSQDPQPLNPSVSFPASAQMIETITNDTRSEMPLLGPSWAKHSFSGTYNASRLQEQVASALNEELLAGVHLKRMPPEVMAAPSQDLGSLVGQSQLTEIAAGSEGQTNFQFLGEPVLVQSALDNRSVFEALPGQDQRQCQNPSQAIRHDNGSADFQTSMAFYQQQPSLVQPSPYIVTQPAVVNKHYEYQDQVNQWSTCSVPYSAAQVPITDAAMGQHYQSQVHHTYNMAAVPDMNGQVWQTSPFYSGAAIEASRRPNPVLYMSTMVPLEQESNQGVAISQMHMPAVLGVPSGQNQPGMIECRYVEAGERTPVTNEVQVLLNPVLSEQLAEQEASSYQYELASEADTISAKYEQAALSEGKFMQQLSSGMVGYSLQQPIEDLQNLSVSADSHPSPGNQLDAFATIGSTIVDSLPSLVEMKTGQVGRNNDVAFLTINTTVRPGEISALPTSILDSALVSQQLPQNLSMPESEHQAIFTQQTTLPHISNEPVPYGSNGPLVSFVDDNLQSPRYKSMTSYSSREREDFSSQPSTVTSEQNNWSSNEATRHVIYDLLTEDPSCSGLSTLSVSQNTTLQQHVSVREASPTSGNMMPSLIDMRDVQATNEASDTAVIDSSSAGNTNESASEQVLHGVSSAQVNIIEQQNVTEPEEENRQVGAKKHKEVHFKNEVTFEESRYTSPEDSSIGSAVLAAEQEAIARGLQTISNEDLEELRELGSGTFGTVYHGKWRGSDVAIKRIKASCFWGHKSEQERLKSDFWREAFILGQLHHPNVVAFYGVVPDSPGGTLATVTEFMVNGSLKQVLQKKDNRTVDRRRRMFIAMDAAFGMEYLHAKNIIHFDLKGENLLVNMRDPHRPICKVGDLGLSKVKHRTMVSGGVRGTLPWMAPELLNGSSNLVSEKVDVFSFGIVMWELLTGEEPYADLHYGAIIGGIVNNALRPTIPKSCDSAWQSLMERCWSNDPASRPTFSDIARELRAMAASQFAKVQPQGQVAA